MNSIKTALLKLKTEASERQQYSVAEHIKDIKENSENEPYDYDIHSFEIGHMAGFDSRKSEINALISIIEKQSEALAECRHGECIGDHLVFHCHCKKCKTQSDVLALLSGIEGK